MDQAISEMVAFNLEHRAVSGISMEHTFWMLCDYWWVIAIIVVLSIVIVKYTKEDL